MAKGQLLDLKVIQTTQQQREIAALRRNGWDNCSIYQLTTYRAC